MMSTSDKRIFTNQDDTKMIDRMKVVMSHAEFFDCLVGYFKITGFYLLKDQLANVKKIRFLVGLGADNPTVKARLLTIYDLNEYKVRPHLQKSIRAEFEGSEDNIDVENGINSFIEWIKSGKIEIRLCADQNVHAKVYIIRNDDVLRDYQYGHVITGSSNFSYSGLEKNIEFNVELKDPADVNYSLQFFNSLWDKSIEITSLVDEIVANETWMNTTITPYQMYLKALASYFEDELGENRLPDDIVPPGYMRLEYQEHAVIQAEKILAKHGGVFIADVVGLGKTYIAAMLAKKLGLTKRKLFIVPPVVQDTWIQVRNNFGLLGRDEVVSLGILDQIAEWKDLNEYDYVFIDEAHRFRNADSKTFDLLKKICYRKGVILITATPQNNYITDIVNLISLFQDLGQSSIIPGNPNLGEFFAALKKELNSKKNTDEFDETLKIVTAQIRDKVLKQVMVRRTRTEVMKYYKDDLDAQGVKFPLLHDPERLVYVYNDKMDEAFNVTIDLLAKLKYARYTPLLYVKPSRQKDVVGDRKSGQENIKGFIKALLIKRLESSIYSFRESIKRINESHQDFLDLFNKDKMVIGNVSHSKYFNTDYLVSLSDEEFNDLISYKDLTRVKREDLIDQYEIDLKNDISIFEQLYNLWSSFDVINDDAKYDVLADLIKKLKANNCEKIIIFSEAKDTVEHIEAKLTKEFPNEVISFSGSDSLEKKNTIKKNFDPKSPEPLNDLNILVTTDAMSEGINLHRANIIINYDLPWNPTRVMQRVGRINRVGSTYDDLYVYNFFPAANTREHLSLEDSIKVKIQIFHTLLGEDSKYLTNEEVVESQAFFDILMMTNLNIFDEGEDFNLNATKMEYLKIINDIYKNDKPLYEEIKNLPNKLRIARIGNENQLVTFVKKGTIKEFILTNGLETKMIEFNVAFEMIKAIETDTKINLPEDYYNLLGLNTDSFKEYLKESFGNGYKAPGTPKNLKEIKRVIKTVESMNLTYDNKDFISKVKNILDKGILSNYIHKQVLNAIKDLKKQNKHNDPNAIVQCFIDNIPMIYFKDRDSYVVNDDSNENEMIILSEYFVKEV